jgi:hypothetical protein
VPQKKGKRTVSPAPRIASLLITAIPLCYRLAPVIAMRKSISVLGLFGVVVTARALAQPLPSPNFPPPCEESKVSRSDRDRAHTVFLSGKQFLEESNYDKAISYFEDAYAIDCSVHGILPIIATAYERKGDRRQAVRALEEYLKRAPTAPDHDVVERRIKNLKDQIAQEPPSQAVAAGPSPTQPPGSITPAVSTPSEPSTGVAQVPGAGTPSAGATAESKQSAVPWVLVGVGGAALAAGVVVVALGASDISSAESACGKTRMNCQPSVANQGNRGRTEEPIGFVVGGAGLAAVAAGLVWYFTQTPSGTPTTGSLHLSPFVAPGYAGVSLNGGF